MAVKDHIMLCWLATADAGGQPNLSPKELFARPTLAELLIAEIASPRSIANIRENPKVCVSLIDLFYQRGEKLEGIASLITPPEPEFAPLAARLSRHSAQRFPISHIIRVEIASVSPLLSPARHFCPELSDADLRAQTLASYGLADLPAP